MAEHTTPSADENPLLTEFFEQWLEAQRMRLMPSTWHGYAKIGRQYLLPHLGQVRVAHIATREINVLYADLMLSPDARVTHSVGIVR